MRRALATLCQVCRVCHCVLQSFTRRLVVHLFDLDPNHRVYNLAEDGLELKFRVREVIAEPAVTYTFVFRDIDGSLKPHYVHTQ